MPAPDKDTQKPEQSGKKSAPRKPTTQTPKEVGGRGGLEPTRYGDWEKDGIISDF